MADVLRREVALAESATRKMRRRQNSQQLRPDLPTSDAEFYCDLPLDFEVVVAGGSTLN